MISLEDSFLQFTKENSITYKKLDGINGDCPIFARLLYFHFLKHFNAPKIYCLNKGIHYWIEVSDYYIDCRGIFKTRDKLLHFFKKFIARENIKEVSIETLNKKYFKNIF